MPSSFPKDFLWGVATSSYQIEGAVHADGRGESIWDRFAHTPGKVLNGDTGDVACDHYHRWQDDIALMKSIGLQAYRFSTAWTRILPEGRGHVNQTGLDFYSSLVDGLLEAGIIPVVNLYHWDLPQALQEQGGWPARATAEAYAEYANVVSRLLGDRVRRWITHNEITCAGLLGYHQGVHAPGIQDGYQALAATHHLLLSHGLGVQVLRSNVPQAEITFVIDPVPAEPATDSPEDYQAYRWFDGYHNRWFLDPLFGRGYPADAIADHIRMGNLPAGGPDYIQPGDMEVIATPFDAFGINYYRRAVLSAASGADTGNPEPSSNPDANHTEMGWEIYPQGLFDIIMQVHLTYRPAKIYITENGASYSDGPGPDGRVRDERRTRYLRDHIAQVQRAITCGAPVAGYFAWSLMDNFEWALGYAQRFGLIWVDFQTQQRILKDSAHWYAQVIRANAIAPLA